MDRDRLHYGDMMAGVSAILLAYFMSLDWFGSKDSGELRLFSVGRNAWEAPDHIPIVLGIAIAAALAVPTLRLMRPDCKPRVPVNALVAVLGVFSVLLILFRIIDPPNFGSFQELWGTITIEGTIRLPIFLALAAAVGIAVGGCLATHEEVRGARRSPLGTPGRIVAPGCFRAAP